MASVNHHSSTSMLLLTFAALCIVSGVEVVTAAGRALSGSTAVPPSLEFYSFEQFYSVPGENTTNVISSPPNGNALAMEWGNLAVSEQPIRASNSSSAPVTGNSPALIIKNKQENNYSVLKLITLDTDKYKGTLFTISDFFLLNDFTTEAEMAVSGGTGSFRDASGYIIVTLVSSGPDHKTYKYRVYLSTCARHPLIF